MSVYALVADGHKQAERRRGGFKFGWQRAERQFARRPDQVATTARRIQVDGLIGHRSFLWKNCV